MMRDDWTESGNDAGFQAFAPLWLNFCTTLPQRIGRPRLGSQLIVLCSKLLR
jgi:hypothetical protein